MADGSSSEEEVILKRSSRSRSCTNALALAPAPAAAAGPQDYESVTYFNLKLLLQLRGVPLRRDAGAEKSDLIRLLREAAQTPEGALKAAEFPASRFDNDTGTTVSVTRTSGAHAANTFFRGLLELRGAEPLEEWPAGSFNKIGDLGNAVTEFIPMALPTLTRTTSSLKKRDLSKDLGRPAAWYDAKNYYADGGVHLVGWLGQESDGVSEIVLPLAETLLIDIEALGKPVVVETKDVPCARCDHCRLFARTFGGPHIGTLYTSASQVRPAINWKKKKDGAGFKATFTCTAVPRAQERLSDDAIRDLRFHATCKDVALLCRNWLVGLAAVDDTKLQEYAAVAIELKHSHQYLGECVRDASTYAKAHAAARKAGRSRDWSTVKHSEINDHTIPMRGARDAEGVFEPTSDDLLAWGKR